jgi:phosphoribosyl 1,2-cyclic phosphodiesterase
VEGIPFFQPFYNTDFISNFWSGRLNGIKTARDIVDGLMKEPYFPIKQEKFLSTIHYKDIADNETLDIGDGIEIQTKPLNHPGKATGYRVNFKGKSFAFITDTTHIPGQQDQALLDFIKDVDLFAYDCSYTDKEFPKFSTFGHSTWEEAVRVKNASGAKVMAGLHHMPFRTDQMLDKIQKKLKAECKGCHVATDGMIIQL